MCVCVGGGGGEGGRFMQFRRFPFNIIIMKCLTARPWCSRFCHGDEYYGVDNKTCTESL